MLTNLPSAPQYQQPKWTLEELSKGAMTLRNAWQYLRHRNFIFRSSGDDYATFCLIDCLNIVEREERRMRVAIAQGKGQELKNDS